MLKKTLLALFLLGLIAASQAQTDVDFEDDDQTTRRPKVTTTTEDPISGLFESSDHDDDVTTTTEDPISGLFETSEDHHDESTSTTTVSPDEVTDLASSRDFRHKQSFQIERILQRIDDIYFDKKYLGFRYVVDQLPRWIRELLKYNYYQYYAENTRVNKGTVKRYVKKVYYDRDNFGRNLGFLDTIIDKGKDIINKGKQVVDAATALTDAINNLVKIAANPNLKGVAKAAAIIRAVIPIVKSVPLVPDNVLNIVSGILNGVAEIVEACNPANPPLTILSGILSGIKNIVDAVPNTDKAVNILGGIFGGVVDIANHASNGNKDQIPDDVSKMVDSILSSI